MKHVLIFLCLLWCTTTISEAAEYTSPASGITTYTVGTDYIDVRFRSGKRTYRYTEEVYGKELIDQMKIAAANNEGLNTLINNMRRKEKLKTQKTESAVFCGERGGYPKNSFKFEISTRSKARAALSYSYWAPDPLGIKQCVCAYYPDFPSCEKIHAIRLIDNLCGDTWCEGHTNYRFTDLICTKTTNTCELSFIIINCDDITKEGTTGSVILKDTTLLDFYPTEDNELSEELSDKLFKLFD